MSETFDPDAWPQSSGPANSGSANGNRGGNMVPRGNGRTGLPTPVSKETESDYDPFFDDEVDITANHVEDSRGRGDSYVDDDDDLFDTPSRQQAPPAGFKDAGFKDVLGTHNDQYEDNGYRANDFDASPGYDAGYDDELDPYDEFDREPKGTGVGIGTKMLAIGGVVVLLGIGGLVGTKLLGGKSDNGAQSPSGDGAATATETPPTEVTDAMNKALSAWGQFAVTGNLDIVKPYFIQDNEQFDRLRSDAETIKAKPPGGDPLVMTMSNVQGKHVKDSEWLVWGPVTVTRPGEKEQHFNWEFRMIRQQSKDPWRVLTIRPIQ